jgi:solute carrier family 8 (sodium/calcium exchanger)
LGSSNWWEQIVAAFYVKGSREEQDNAGGSDWFTHIIWFPWQMLFAILTPPTNYVGGWFCFWFSLLHIGWLTILVGDLAELFGCVTDIDDSITAITFVALGTSVPDLFASRTAAKTDEWADASIVNVTGSNSVNIFLGIGLPWMMAAIFWDVNGADDDWRTRYPCFLHLDGAFIVDSSGLAFSVTVFTLAACTCLLLILVRRHTFGGELGGPPDAKAYSSFFLILLWLFYIGLSCWQISTENNNVITQLVVMALSVPAIAIFMLIFSMLLQLLKWSKQYIGEEGFWGIFIASVVIFGRMLIYAAFQYEW